MRPRKAGMTLRLGLPVMLAGAVLGAGPGGAHAQSNWSRVAVPFYSSADFVHGMHRYWTQPKSAAFAARAKSLTGAVQALCEAPASGALPAARKAWQAAMLEWERLAAVTVGPLIERRTRLQVDFMPTRPTLIERAIQTAPADAAAMERIGAPARGLPALEWLLWTRPVKPASAGCRYAVQVAADIEREAQALQSAFERAADRQWDEDAVAAMSEALNQWVGGMERLRWVNMEKPLRAGGGSAALPRAASGSSALSQAAQWEALRAYAVLAGETAPQPGDALIPLETYLRGRGLNQEADALVRAVRRVDARMQRLAAAPPPHLLEIARELAALKRVVEAEVAPALRISIGFSDTDGD